MHVLTARVRGGDSARLWAGVPVVDGVVVLDPRVSARPRRLAHLSKELAGFDRLYGGVINA